MWCHSEWSILFLQQRAGLQNAASGEEIFTGRVLGCNLDDFPFMALFVED